MRCSWHDPRRAAHWRWWPPLGWRTRRRGSRHRRWRCVGRRRGRRVSCGTAPPCVLLNPVRSSRARARSRTAATRRRRGRGVHRRSRLHARRDARELGPPAWANARRGLSVGTRWVEVWIHRPFRVGRQRRHIHRLITASYNNSYRWVCGFLAPACCPNRTAAPRARALCTLSRPTAARTSARGAINSTPARSGVIRRRRVCSWALYFSRPKHHHFC